MSKILSLMSVFTFPLSLLNAFAGTVGVLWLVMLGEWGDIFFAIVATFLSSLLVSWVLMIPIAIMLPAAFLVKKGLIGKVLAFPFQLISSISIWVIIGLWGIFIFNTALSEVGNNPEMPYLLIAYSVSVGTWSFMASAEDNPEQYTLLLLTSQLGAGFLLIALGFIYISVIKLITIYLSIFLIGFIIQIITGLTNSR